MKYVITNKQYNLISEALGVPDSILDAAEEFYNIFLEDIKSISSTEEEYNFSGDVDITLGGKKKIHIDEYTLRIDVNTFEEFEDSPKISSMGMGQSFTFDRDILMKRVQPSTEAEFSITFVAKPDWEYNELYDEFVKNKEERISDISHELKHKYDKQVKQVDLMGHDAEYAGVQRSPRFGIDAIDSEFLHYLYYTNVAENLVRTTEVASQLRSKNTSRKDFIEFLRQNPTFQMLSKIKNFTFEKLVDEIGQNMGQVDKLMEQIGKNPHRMTDEQKINKVLELVYINVGSARMEAFDDFIKGPMGGLFELFQLFGGSVPKESENVEEIRKKFYKYLTKYKKRPLDFFKDEIEKFHVVADKTIKKLSKLYAMTSSSQTNESIINWELHRKLMEKKHGNKIVTEIGRESGHFEIEPLENFFDYLSETLSKKKKTKYFWDFFHGVMGKGIEYDDYFSSDVVDYFADPKRNEWNEEFKSKEARSAFAYYIAKHHFGLEKGAELDYIKRKEPGTMVFYFFDPSFKIFVGRIYLSKEHDYFKNTYKVGLSAADEELIGAGYGIRMYLTILQNVDYLLSDDTLYSGSYRIWKHSLPKYANVWGVQAHHDYNNNYHEYHLFKNFTKIDPTKKTSVRKFDRFIASLKHKTVE